MAARKKGRKRQATPPPSVHAAERVSGPSGAVWKGPEIDLTAAVARRQAGLDVVVCGENVDANRQVAGQIEAMLGPYQRDDPHRHAGPHALPHFHQASRNPERHTFYETGNPQRKARRRP